MKPEFKAKFLQHQRENRQSATEGFTLIELLVVIIIIGILSAIALPSFLNQANKAKETESKQYVGSMNRTQQAYFLEKNSFASDISLLGLGIKTDSVNYTYTIDASVSSSAVINLSYPKNTLTLRAHTGGVQVAQTAQSEATTLAILCQSVKATSGTAAGVGFSAATSSIGPTCGTNYEPLLN